MAKNATTAPVVGTTGSKVKPTYKIEGEVKTLEQMLEVKTKCGEQRYVLMDQRSGQPEGTLADKLFPLLPIRSIQAEDSAAERKRVAEGHRYQKPKVLELR